MASPVPSFAIKKEDSITLTIPQTDARLADQGYTYNQAGFTYNQIGVEYGGVYKQNSDIFPALFTSSLEKNIYLTISKTDAVLNDQGYTYNQANFTYNQIGLAYGGISKQNQDISPLVVDALFIHPSIQKITDIYTQKPKPATNPTMGVGWFMYVLRG